mgnify:CR=1 FL=1
MSKKILEAIFSESLYFTNIKANHKKYLKALMDLKMHQVYIHEPLLEKSKREEINTGNYISVNKKILHTKQFKSLKDILYKEIKTGVQDAFKYDVDFTIENSWGTMSQPNAVSEFHTHSNYWYSAVYYPHGTDEDNMSITFDKSLPSFFTVPIKQYKHYNQHQYVLRVTEGDLIVFPATLRHKIGFNFTKQNRYSLALNILPKGNIGDGDGSREL